MLPYLLRWSGDTAEEMLDMAEDYLEIGPNITIKVPCTPEGLKACRDLSNDDIQVNVTLVFDTAQAILAAKAGATYVSPFVGRVFDQSLEWHSFIEEIADVFATHNVKTQVLAASIREPIKSPTLSEWVLIYALCLCQSFINSISTFLPTRV